MSNSEERITTFLAGLEASQILLAEWETTLQIRLGYPLVSDGVSQPTVPPFQLWQSNTLQSLFFLVPDNQLQKVRELAADIGLSLADEETLNRLYPSENCTSAIRYVIDDSDTTTLPTCMARRRIVFVPMSWTGITRDDLVPIADQGNHPTIPKLLSSVQTVPLPATCAALIRIISREKRGNLARIDLIEGLSSIIGYSLFDMSQEGNYMEILPNSQPLSEDEILEIDHGIAEIKKWAMRKGEEWMRDLLVEIVAGKKRYSDLPALSRR